MFKRIILALFCLSFTLSGFSAKLTATLQSGDKVTPFYGDSAFVKAYNAAVNGDVITLSPGDFKATDIEKSITVIGTYAFSDDLSKATHFSGKITITGDNVTLEGIRFIDVSNDISNGLCIKGADNLIINRCRMDILSDQEGEGKKYHNNTILTDSYINCYNAMSLSQNTTLRNCSVYRFCDKNEINNPALIENCNVSYFDQRSKEILTKQPYAIYRNCCLGLFRKDSSGITYLYFSAPSEFHNNCFYESFYYSNTSTNDYYWSIDYGSAVHSNNIKEYSYKTKDVPNPLPGSFTPFTKSGVPYGPADHKGYPAIPSITSSEIDTKTDADGSLHVKITATARD